MKILRFSSPGLVAFGMITLSMQATAAQAEPSAGGFDAELSVGFDRYDYGDDFGGDRDGPIYSGMAAYTDRSGFGGQLDLVYDKKTDNFGFSIKRNTVAGHVFYRSQDRWLLGAMLQRTNIDFVDVPVSEPTSRAYAIEGQYYLQDFTLYGQVGRNKLDSPGFQPDSDGSNALAQVRYFPNDNWRVDLTGTYNTSKVDGFDVKSKAKTLAIGTEYRFPDMPVSVFAQIGKTWIDIDTFGYGFDFDHSNMLVGFKVSFGKETLKRRDREGVSLQPVKLDDVLFVDN